MSLCLSSDRTRIETPRVTLAADSLAVRVRRLFMSLAPTNGEDMLPAPRAARSVPSKTGLGATPMRGDDVNSLLL